MRGDWVDRSEYPFKSRWATLPSGERMHYVDEGTGETVLFVHGTPTWSFDWRRLITALAATHRCIAVDHIGFGLSDRPARGAYTPEWHAENLAGFVRTLGIDRFTLVVHDFGGPIGLPLALDAPERIDGLVIFNSWMWSVRGDAAMVRAARLLGSGVGRLLYRYANFSLRVIAPAAFADRRKLTAGVHRHYLAPFPDAWSREAVLWALARALLASDSHYASLWSRRAELGSVPAQIIWGTKDPAFGAHHLARWRETLPDAEVAELPVGHWPAEEAPGDVIRVMQQFLSRRAPKLPGTTPSASFQT